MNHLTRIRVAAVATAVSLAGLIGAGAAVHSGTTAPVAASGMAGASAPARVLASPVADSDDQGQLEEEHADVGSVLGSTAIQGGGADE